MLSENEITGLWLTHRGRVTQFARAIEQKTRSASAAPAEGQQAAWLVEWPANDNLPARWWHPQCGWCIDANKAMRFARREDADAYIETRQMGGVGVFASEHIWHTGADGREAVDERGGSAIPADGRDSFEFDECGQTRKVYGDRESIKGLCRWRERQQKITNSALAEIERIDRVRAKGRE